MLIKDNFPDTNNTILVNLVSDNNPKNTAMKKHLLNIFRLLTVILILMGTNNASAQIQDLDKSYYYRIGCHWSLNFLGIAGDDITIDGAQLQQQILEGGFQLWEIRNVTDSTYRFINSHSGMALGWTTWRGTNPDPEGQSFVWRGSWYGAAQRLYDPEDETQIWQPTYIGENEDSIFYRVTSIVNYYDSAFSFNCWANVKDVGVKNIALIAGLTTEPDSYIDPNKGYSYFFEKTGYAVPPSWIKQNSVNNINIYSQNGFIIIKGAIKGEQVEVFDILGKFIYQANASGEEIYIQADRGIYIIKAGDSVSKLVNQ